MSDKFNEGPDKFVSAPSPGFCRLACFIISIVALPLTQDDTYPFSITFSKQSRMITFAACYRLFR